MKYKIATRYQGDSGIAGEVEAEAYTRKIKFKLLALVTRLMNFPGFAWQILNEENEVIDSYNC